MGDRLTKEILQMTNLAARECKEREEVQERLDGMLVKIGAQQEILHEVYH